MLINDLSETSPRRRRIIQQPLRTEPPIALIGGDARASSELEALLKRGHPLITFPSLSHFLAEPPRGGREGWAAIVMVRASAWDVRLERHVARRRNIALFAQPEEGYGWPEDVARVRDLDEVGAWLERLKEPDPIVLKKSTPRAPRKPRTPAPTETPSWLQQDARVWNALGAAQPGAAATEPAQPAPSAPAATRTTRRPPEQLELAELAGTTGARKQPKSARPPAARGARDKANGRAAPAGRSKAPSKPVRKPAATQQEWAPQRISEITQRVLKGLKPLAARDEIKFLQAAAEVGIVRASELLAELHARASRLA